MVSIRRRGRNDSLGSRAGGTNYGGDRDTDEWVGITKVEMPIATGELTGGASTSGCRLGARVIEGDRRLVVPAGCRARRPRYRHHGEFTVRIGRADVLAEERPMEVIMGDAATVIDIAVPTPVWCAGEAIRGQVTLTPTMDLPDGDLAVCWQRHRESHPLSRTPSPGGSRDGPMVPLGKRIPLRAGSPILLPFEIPLPADAPPTAAAVHSSMNWFVQARLFTRVSPRT